MTSIGLKKLTSVILLLVLIFFGSEPVFAQADSCEISLPFCTTDKYVFPASTNTTAQSGPDYGCLNSQPNPAWYHMKIALAGDININMESYPPRDIDFICWGPFTDAFSPCAGDLTSSNIIDCSYANWTVENCYIPDGQVDEYYILMITNYSGQECDIIFQKTAGTGETDCTIVPPPVSNNGPLCVGDTLMLYADYVENTTYSWSGPDGFVSTEQNPIIPDITLINAGNYFLEVTTLGSTSNPTHTSVAIIALPDLSFTIDPNDTVCVNETVTFNGIDSSGTNITSWQWAFGDGNTSNIQNPTHIYGATLVDSVRLIAINDNACVDTTYNNIEVRDPTVDFNVSPKPACIGTTIDFTGIGNVTYSDWNWSFGDGNTAIGQISSHLYATADTFEVTLNVCSKTVIDSAFVMPLAVANAGSSETICESLPYDFATSSTQPSAIGYDSLIWYGGTGSFDNPRVLLPVYTPAIGEVGDIQFSLVVYGKLPCSNDTSYVTITYDTLPDPGYIQIPIDSICVNEMISFTDTSTTNVQIWHWDFDDGNSSTIQNPDHAYLAAGVHNLKLIVTNDKGCSDSITTPIQIHPLPEPDFNILPNDTACAEMPITFNGFDIIGTTITNWNWDFGDGNTSTLQNPYHTYNVPGDYTVILTVLNNNSCSESRTKSVHINSLPESDFTISPNDTSCMGELINFDATDISGDITSWDWQFGDGNTATGQNVTHDYSGFASQTFNILSIYQNANGCLDTTIHHRYVQDIDIGFDMIENPSCQNYIVNFTGTGDLVTFTDWNWDFGDGSPGGLGHNVSHIYTQSDTLDVILNVCSEQNVQQLIIHPTCQVDAGSDEATCENVNFDLSTSSTPPTADGFTNVYWYTNGAGSINDPTLVTPVYYPDSIEGSVQVDTVYMTMVGYGISPCENDTSQMMLLIVPGAYAQAGSDENSCIGYPYDFANSTDSSFAANYVVLYWMTSGTGYFVDPNVEQPIYIPGLNEIGPVTLTMVAANIINCDSIDEMVLTIRPEHVTPFDTTICYNDSLFAQGAWHFVSGIFYDTLQSQYGCDSVIITYLTVRPKIDQDFIISTSDSICYGETVSFTSTGSANITSWYWDFGDGIVSTATNPTHQYDTSGYFTVIYNYTDDNGCSDTATDQVRVFELPDVWFTDNMTNPCINTQIDFSGSSTFNIVSWEWDFGDGQVGTGQNISHVYTTWGNMIVSLTVIDINGCTETDYQLLNIAEPPTADFTYNIIVCDSLQFTDLSYCPAGYNIVRWYWNFGDGTTDTLQNPTHHYPYSTTSGGELYNVSLMIIADSSGYECADSVELVVVVPELPNIFYTFDPDPSCFGDITYFYGESDYEIDVWDWDFGDGNFSSDQYTSNIYADTGSYNSVLTITDTNGCINTLGDTVVVNPLPDVSFTMNTSYACVNYPVEFYGTSTFNIVQWDWDFGDGQTGTGQNTSHIYTTWGTMTIGLTVTDINGCSEVAYNNLYVAEPPIADFTYSVIVCDSMQFTDLSTSPPDYNLVTWNWDFGDGGSSTLQNPTHQYPHSTTPGGEVYYVTLVVAADSLGFICTDSVVLTVTVPSLPDIFFTWSPDPTCIGDSTYFFGESGYPIDIWHWDFDDGNFSLDSNAVHSYATTGTYNVVLNITDTNGCVNTLSDIVTVDTIPEVSFTMSDSVLCHGGSISFFGTGSSDVTVWYWEFGDGSFSYDQNPIHFYPAGGTYTVSLTAITASGCSTTTTDQVLILPGPTADYTYANLTCSSVIFTDLSTAPTGYNLVEWFWDFDDGFTATVQNPSHSFAGGIGVYDVMLIVTADSMGYSCTDTIIQTVLTPGLPTVFFTWDPEPTMLGDATSFFGTSGNTITDWYWDFGDGNFATTQDATNTFATVGTFDVELTVTDIDGCINSIIHQVTVTHVPELDFTWEYSCEGDPVQFTVLDPPTDIPAVVSWSWDFGDGGVSTDMDPIHVYITASTYSVSLTIVDTMGATNTVVKSITVNPLPNALFSIETPSCEGNPVQFHNHSTTPTGFITEWIWDFGDGNTTTVNFPDNPDVDHTYASTGTYIVTLTVTNSDSCSNSTQNQVTTIPSPMAMFTHSSGCASGPVTFSDTSIENGGGTIITWNWNFDDPASGPDNTSTLQNPVHLFSASGDYDVQLIITNINGCSDTTNSTVTVADEPEVDFTYTDACLGSETQFIVDEAVTNVGEVQTWAWSFGDGGTSNLQNPTHTYAATGDYTVTLAIVTTDGCSASVTHTVRINPLPNPNFEHTGPACLNDTVYFTDLSSSPNGLIISWHWDFGDGTEITIEAPNNPDVSHIYTNDATFAVALTTIDSDSCENTVVKNVEIVPSPIADFTFEETCYDEPVYFTDLSTTNGGTDIMSWEWLFGDPQSGVDNTSTLQDPIHVFSEPGNYTTTLTIVSTLGCADTIDYEIVVDSLPFVEFTIANDSNCVGESVEFTGIGTNISVWFWDFGDGGYSLEQNPSYTYNAPGTYTVILTVTEIGLDECQNSVSHTINVNDAPEANFEYNNTCLGDSTYFTDLSYSQNGFIASWEWDFGDGNTSTEEDPIHYYQDNDDYEVTLISFDNYGCSDTITQWVQIFDLPLPGFTFEQQCEPSGQVNFFDESEPGEDGSPIIEWNWSLDDGYYTTEVDPSYIYPATDTCYTVILEITDGNGCIATDTNDQVCLYGTLEIDFTSTKVCLGQRTYFTASYNPSSDSVASYTWNFNDGSPLEVTYHDTISHIFPNPTIYIVELMAVDTNGCSANTNHEVIIDSLPIPQFTNTTGICNEPIQFTDISFGGGEFIEFWYWDFGNIASGAANISTDQHPTHLYGPYDSTYQVKLIVTNFNGCVDSVVQDVISNSSCLYAYFWMSWSGTCHPICTGNTLYFRDSSTFESTAGEIVLWEWDFGDGTTETYTAANYVNSVPHNYSTGGDYNVTLTVTAETPSMSYTDQYTIPIHVSFRPDAIISTDNNCYPDTTWFADESIVYDAPVISWEWNFGDLNTEADTSIIANPWYLYPAYNTYLTTLILVDTSGCTDTTTKEVTIFKPPEAAFSFEETCMSYYTYFIDESIGENSTIDQYMWNFGDTMTIEDTSTLQFPEYIYDNLGYYTVQLRVSDTNQCLDTISHELEVHPLPTAGFNIMDTLQQGQIYLDNTSIDGITYYWDFDYDYGMISTEKNPIHQYEIDGNYNIMLVSYNEFGCPDTTYQLYELLFTNLFVPNAFVPSNSNPDLQTFKPVGINLRSYTIEIYNTWGNLVFRSIRLEDGAPAEGWDGTYKGKKLPTGSYIWHISAVFTDGRHWRGTDNGDGNTSTSGTVTLIR